MTISAPNYQDKRFDADDNRWESVKRIIGGTRVTLGPQASDQWFNAPEHLAMVLARYRAAAALIGDAHSVLEIGCGEGIGANILKQGRRWYYGIDSDRDAIKVASQSHMGHMAFESDDFITTRWNYGSENWPALVSLDVIEHIAPDNEAAFMGRVGDSLTDEGVCVIGTPSKNAEHLASPQSQAGHINLYTPERLKTLMGRYFHVVQMLYMQDTGLHLGHPEMAHYLMAVGIGPKRG